MQAARSHRVVAQGQILPNQGFIQLAAAPGDIVEQVLVEVGQQVGKNQPLVKMRSEAVRDKQLQALQGRLEAAQRNQDQVELKARQQLTAAKLKLEHLQAQEVSLAYQRSLLDKAQEQVAASKSVLQKLEGIAGDRLTGEFVGQLEVDRQKVAVGEAELKYEQQKETYRRAEEDLRWAQKVAQAELAAAEELHAIALQSDATEVIKLEMETLQEQKKSALILAPISGMVVAVNANEGEASVQLPLVEMANLDQMVCEVEINEMDAARVKDGAAAIIRSRAFGDKQLTGIVKAKYAMVGRPQLKPLDPLARVDYRTVTAVVSFDAGESTEEARRWLQLQVEVEIQTQGNQAAK